MLLHPIVCARHEVVESVTCRFSKCRFSAELEVDERSGWGHTRDTCNVELFVPGNTCLSMGQTADF